MSSQRKAKLLILLAILILVALIGGIIFQLVKMKQVEKQIQQQEKDISQLQEELESFQKQPGVNDDYYDIVLGGEN